MDSKLQVIMDLYLRFVKIQQGSTTFQEICFEINSAYYQKWQELENRKNYAYASNAYSKSSIVYKLSRDDKLAKKIIISYFLSTMHHTIQDNLK